MRVTPTKLPGMVLIEPRVFRDERGFFLEMYHAPRYREHGINTDFVQDNRAFSSRGVLRGLHFQSQHPQAKLVWVTQGEVFDVALDLRRGSSTFGQWEGVLLSAENHKQVFIPAGFAHGYCVTSETADLFYKCSALYHPHEEGGVLWNDPDLAIEWPLPDPILSDKDKKLPCLRDLETPFSLSRD
ncbi:MAG: dTDP-4-dehydrorhamnose 3,5-epimerase [Nitrospinaceae bacterium]